MFILLIILQFLYFYNTINNRITSSIDFLTDLISMVIIQCLTVHNVYTAFICINKSKALFSFQNHIMIFNKEGGNIKMARHSSKLIVSCLISTFLWGNLCIANMPNNEKQNTIILYEQKVDNLNNEQMDKLWPSNNPRSWILTGTMDNEITKKYKAWSNQYKSLVKGTADERGLNDNTDLTIYIKNLNINASDYKDIRLIIDYFSNNSTNSLTHTYSMELYAIDKNNKKYGPFNIGDFETTGFYMRKVGSKQIFERNFNIVSESIKVPPHAIIKELIIKPYANYPRVRKDGKTMAGNWRGADSVLFEVSGMKIAGYKQTHYQRPDYIKIKTFDESKIREKIVQRMYDQATIKWSPSVEFHDTRVVGSDPNSVRTTYKPNITYYGLPYTQRNRVSIEAFKSNIQNGVLASPKDLLQVWGADCASSVSYPLSKFIPMHVIYNTTDFIWDRNKTTLLGNLLIDGKESSTESFIEKNKEEKMYEGYAMLQKGDIVSTHYAKNTHVRLITGNTHVERGSDGNINPYKSYFIHTDIRIGQANTAKDSNDFGGQIDSWDYIVPFTPKKEYTDIKRLVDLEGKNLNFYINRKETFKEALNRKYVPITLNAYLTKTTEVPYAKIINANTAENIKNGLKGTIISNYVILSVKITITNTINGENKAFVVYPNHNANTLEGMYCNTYSLYHNTPLNIQNYIKNVFKNSGNFEVTISVDAGENENMQVLSLRVNTH